MSNTTVAPAPLDWCHIIAEVPARGLDVVREATPAERDACAASLDAVSIDRLAVRYRTVAASGNRFILTGTIKARVVQACVVSLDPVPAVIDEPLHAEFHNPGELPAADETEQGALEAVEHELIINQQLQVGRVVFETLAAALPAFPRAPGAALEQNEAAPEGGGSTNPFAGLADWKPKPR